MRIFTRFIIVVLMVLLRTGFALSAGAPENVAVVVNEDSPWSVAVANEYVRLREIPAANVIYISGVTNHETMEIDDFRDNILKPVFDKLKDRGVFAQIDCITYSTDFPWQIKAAADCKSDKVPPYCTPFCSITGLTYLYEKVFAKEYLEYANLKTNNYARRVLLPTDVEWSEKEKKDSELIVVFFKERGKRRSKRESELKAAAEKEGKKYNRYAYSPDEATLAWEKEEWLKIIPLMEKLATAHPNNSNLLYNLSCAYAQTGNLDRCAELLNKAYLCGYWNYHHTLGDFDMRPVLKHEGFKAVIEKMKRPEFKMLPPVAFSSETVWGEDGLPADKGRKYILSTMLPYTSGRCLSLEEALSCLRMSVKADATFPKGTVYFMWNWNVRSTTREWAFHYTMNRLKEFGVNAVIDRGEVPKGKDDVIGAVIGTSDFNWVSGGSKIMPGAIIENLTSYGGSLFYPSCQTPMIEFIRGGAAGTSGTVNEPYALQDKFPMPTIQLYYAQGFSLAESFYLAVRGPFQLLVMGDPLCRPWGKKPDIMVDGLSNGQEIKGDIEIIASSPGNRISRFEYYVDGLKKASLEAEKHFVLPYSSLSSGSHVLSIVGVSANDNAVRGRKAIGFTIGSNDVSVTVTGYKKIALDKKLKLSVKSIGVDKVVLSCNSRHIFESVENDFVVEIDASQIGIGSATVIAEGYKDGKLLSRSVPHVVEINIPEDSIDPVGFSGQNKLKDGVLLSINGKCFSLGGYIKRRSGCIPDEDKKGQFTVDAMFEIENDGVYQFQIAPELTLLKLSVSGKDISFGPKGKWRFVAVMLKKGWHALKAEGDFGENKKIDIRFGGKGAPPLLDKIFKHVPVDGEIDIYWKIKKKD